MNPYIYDIKIKPLSDDKEIVYEANITELPDSSDYGDTPEEAYERAISTLYGAHELYKESGRKFPSPKSKYTGRITLRLPRFVHKSVVLNSKKEDVSINQLLLTIIIDGLARLTLEE